MKQYIFIIVVFTLIFLIFQISINSILGFDAFYYLKEATLLVQDNFNFPYLPYTSLSNEFHGLHFLSYFIYIPFIKLFGSILGGKILISLIISLFFTYFYYLLKKLLIKYPYIYLVILWLISPVWLVRINLIRPSVLFLLLSLIGIYYLIKRYYFGLLILSILLPLFYDGFFFFMVPIAGYLISYLIINKRIELKLLFTYLFGTSLGLLFNPYFPNNIIYLNNLFQTKINGFESNIVEWQGSNLISLLFHSPLLTLILILPWLLLLLHIVKRKLFTNFKLENNHKIIWVFLFVLTNSYLILTLIANRFIEYLAPYSIILCAFSLNLFILYPDTLSESLLINFKKILNKNWLKLLLIISIISLFIFPLTSYIKVLKKTPPLNQYQETATWLKNNTPEKSIIFYPSYDSFTKLFYLNHHNYYIAGLDPIFNYLYSPSLYYLWQNISNKQCAIDYEITECLDNKKTAKVVAESILNKFNSEYIWLSKVNKKYLELNNFLKDNPDYFELMIEVEDSLVYKINYIPSASN